VPAQRIRPWRALPKPWRRVDRTAHKGWAPANINCSAEALAGSVRHDLPDDYLFTRVKKGDKRKLLTRDHYREVVKSWARIARADPRAFSTDSLRRTKAAYIYEQTRKSVSATSAYLNVSKRKFDI
jgi:hypothetical protein